MPLLLGIKSSYGSVLGSVFAGIDSILFPDLLALASGECGHNALYGMLLVTAPHLSSLLNRKLMMKDAVAEKSSRVAHLENELASITAEYKRKLAKLNDDISDLNKRLKSE